MSVATLGNIATYVKGSPDAASGQKPAATQDWRTILPVHPAAEIIPAQSKEKLSRLGRNIKAAGKMLVPIVVLAEPADPTAQDLRARFKYSVLDGRSRLDAMVQVGIKFVVEWTIDGPMIVADGYDIPKPQIIPQNAKFDPVDFTTRINMARRQCNRADTRELIVKLLTERPNWTDNAIAKAACVSHSTVAAIRRNCQIGNCANRVEADGKKARGRSPKVAGPTNKVDVQSDQVHNQAREQANAVVAPHVASLMITRAQVDRIIQLTRDISALLNKPRPPNIDTCRKKLAGIRSLIKNASKPAVITATNGSPNTTTNNTSAFRRAMCLEEPVASTSTPETVH
jgi:hypothetical protein